MLIVILSNDFEEIYFIIFSIEYIVLLLNLIYILLFDLFDNDYEIISLF